MCVAKLALNSEKKKKFHAQQKLPYIIKPKYISKLTSKI